MKKTLISENRSRLLPQINIGAALNDNFTPPVSVTDGRAFGTFFKKQVGVSPVNYRHKKNKLISNI